MRSSNHAVPTSQSARHCTVAWVVPSGGRNSTATGIQSPSPAPVEPDTAGVNASPSRPSSPMKRTPIRASPAARSADTNPASTYRRSSRTGTAAVETQPPRLPTCSARSARALRAGPKIRPACGSTDSRPAQPASVQRIQPGGLVRSCSP